MDIGTAKASREERAAVPHHLIDQVEPDVPFSVEEFQRLAREKIEEIQARGHLPMLVGGTGLYIQAVTHGYRLPGVGEDPGFREKLHQLADREETKPSIDGCSRWIRKGRPAFIPTIDDG